MTRISLVFSMLFFSVPALTLGASLVVMPENPMQGEPVMVVVEGADIPAIKTASFFGQKLNFFLYQGKPIALIPIDLAQRAGDYPLVVKLSSGETLKKTVAVVLRPKITAPLGIPEKLGGNTKVAQDSLVTMLSKENTILAKIKTTLLPMWGSPFTFPVKAVEIVDAYGYSRSTGSYSIPHKGTDFRATVGTEVRAINGGIVRLAREFTIYGKTVAIDHGGGVVSFSMHLSKIQVKEGQKVKQGDLLGLSGESGYALGPHLHLSVKIYGISIDPMKFFSLFTLK
ncbi:MAG: M23 family metallopeptidase [bacterium]|nr:M23 family metallopeptidase [bacterium]